ncbi:MAG: DUF4411 family protein [Bacteroidetes bacterium]|nr:DUF4411 family protein [Bacteroidota bacterium]MCL5027494.1 DUF4411 family protein [Bacteroidota bacterium]
MYSVDTNIFLDWWDRRYPPDLFPSVKKAIEELINQGKFFAPERVLEEIHRVGSNPLKNWAKSHKQIFLPHDVHLQEEANEIQFKYPDLIDNNSPYDEADRWLIALAKLKEWIVITHETSVKNKRRPDRNLYIPDVCNSMKIPCKEFLELLRIEKLSF